MNERPLRPIEVGIGHKNAEGIAVVLKESIQRVWYKQGNATGTMIKAATQEIKSEGPRNRAAANGNTYIPKLRHLGFGGD